MTDYASFRQRLDAVLRTLDVKQVSDFLIAERQWSPGKPADSEFAMWMMIAGSPTLRDLHDRAREWLMTHGHEEDAAAFLTRDKQQGARPNKGRSGQRRSSDTPSGTSKADRKRSSNTPTTGNQKKLGSSKPKMNKDH